MNNNVAKYLFYFIEYLRGENVIKYLKELEMNQFLSKESINVIQEGKLTKLLDYTIANNKYYKNKYNGFDVHNSFESLPVLTKEELRDNYKNILSDIRQTKLDLVETSGSTGIPLQFYRDRIVFGYTLASLYRAHRWWGIDVGYKEAMLWGVPVSSKGRMKVKAKDLLLNRFREKEYNINAETLYNFYINIKTKKPEYVFGYASMVYEFALYLKDNNLDARPISLKAAICTAEKLYEHQRNLIEEVFGCKVVSEYGATETGIISYQCQHGSNHISDDCVYVEIVDENNNCLPDGETGRVLITVLNSFSSPIIRYDIGDISSKLTIPCTCGVNLSVLGDVDGRACDVVVCPNGKVYHSIIFYYIMKALTENIGGVKQFKVYQKKINELEIHIVKGKYFAEEANAFIQSQFKDKFGESMNLNIFYCDQIQRSKSGKFKDFETEIDVTPKVGQYCTPIHNTNHHVVKNCSKKNF